MIGPGSRVRRLYPARERGQTGMVIALRDCGSKARVRWDARPPVGRPSSNPRTERLSTLGLYALALEETEPS